MNLRHLIFFRELARTQHMAQAAENLGISQPSLSYAIKKLETELGVPLFEPEGRNIRLTQLGRVYLKYINESLTTLKDGNTLIKELINPDSGHVNLGFTYTLGQRLVPELLTEFKKIPENHQINFSLGQSYSANLLTGLLNEKYDVVLSSHIDKLGDQDANQLFKFQPIVQQEIKLAVPVNHPLARKKQIMLTDLKKYPMIIFSQNSGLRPLIDKILAQGNISPNIIYQIEEDHTIAGFVQYGMGIALIPNLPQLDREKVILRTIKDNHLKHELFLVTRQEHFVTPSVQRFTRFVLNYCQQNFADKHLFI